jgi:ATP-dependent Clp protease adaptor protein ClpS
MSMSDPRFGESTEILEKQALKEPPRFKVLLHNDNYTTMEFVVYILVEIFHHSEIQAIKIMLQVHLEGVGIAGIYTHEIAETKVAQVVRMARQYEYPLMCTIEEE